MGWNYKCSLRLWVYICFQNSAEMKLNINNALRGLKWPKGLQKICCSNIKWECTSTQQKRKRNKSGYKVTTQGVGLKEHGARRESGLRSRTYVVLCLRNEFNVKMPLPITRLIQLQFIWNLNLDCNLLGLCSNSSVNLNKKIFEDGWDRNILFCPSNNLMFYAFWNVFSAKILLPVTWSVQLHFTWNINLDCNLLGLSSSKPPSFSKNIVRMGKI